MFKISDKIIRGYMRNTFDKYTPPLITNKILLYYYIPIHWKRIKSIKNIEYSNDLLTVTNTHEYDAWEMVISTLTISKGKVSISIKILDEFVLMIGFVKESYKPSQGDTFYKMDYGLYCDGQKYNTRDYMRNYAISLRPNDIVKCVIDIDKQTIEYYINGKSYGIAFKKIPKITYRFAVAIYSKNISIQILPNKFFHNIM